ncbi:MAG: phospholipid carrier-dependent glycosyltransferase [Symploca sp. SIO2E9]|nr:phospholipid carrier-dependent glycosyltransferase [Symploca sp. SIO2E9]
MNNQTFIWGRSGNRIRKTERWVEGLSVFGLLLAALLLFSINLDSLPLQDWCEDKVELIAHHLVGESVDYWQWLYPQNLPEPPLGTWLIASAYELGGINDWMARLPSAILTALSVPLLYGIGREIFHCRQSAVFSSLIYLTLLPVIYHGRLASADGSCLCFAVLMMWCVLRSRRDFRWALGIGIGLSLICLTKGIGLGLLLGVIALLFLRWDTPRLLISVYWWLGLLLGISPGIAWYTGFLLVNVDNFNTTGIFNQSLQSFWLPWLSYSPPPLYYLVEILAVPWLLFLPSWLSFAWKHRNWSWAKFVLVWAGFYLLAIALMISQKSWYFLPIYPALALAGGYQLATIWNGPSCQIYPRFWSLGLSLLAIGFVTSSLGFKIQEIQQPLYQALPIFCASIALTMIIAAVLVARRNLQFMIILLWGTYISLLLLMISL